MSLLSESFQKEHISTNVFPKETFFIRVILKGLSYCEIFGCCTYWLGQLVDVAL